MRLPQARPGHSRMRFNSFPAGVTGAGRQRDKTATRPATCRQEPAGRRPEADARVATEGRGQGAPRSGNRRGKCSPCLGRDLRVCMSPGIRNSQTVTRTARTPPARRAIWTRASARPSLMLVWIRAGHAPAACPSRSLNDPFHAVRPGHHARHGMMEVAGVLMRRQGTDPACETPLQSGFLP